MSGFFGQGRLGRGTGGSCRALLGMSSKVSVDDIAGIDLPGVTPGHALSGGGGIDLPGVTPGHALDGGGGGGGIFVSPLALDDLLFAPEDESILMSGLYLCGRSGTGTGLGMQKHAKAIGERLAVAKMACG